MEILLAQGAEAHIYLKNTIVRKVRSEKKYRIPEIDQRLRKARTLREAKILQKIYAFNFAPEYIGTNNKDTITMKYIQGQKLASCLEKTYCTHLGKVIGAHIKQLHDIGIIHGDLTTSNMILQKSNVFFIDYGLSFFSEKVEDKAVDLHVLREALEAKHHTIAVAVFHAIITAYNDKEVLKKLEKVQKRGRNKEKKIVSI